MLSDGELLLFDFADAGAIQRNDHIVMMSWLLHDLQLEAPRSYETGIYSAVHAAGEVRALSRPLMFVPEKGFFSPGLDWVHAHLSALNDIDELPSVGSSFWAKVESASKFPIRLPKTALMPSVSSELVGFVDWASVPFVSFSPLSNTKMFHEGVAVPNYPTEPTYMELDLPSVAIDANRAVEQATFATAQAELVQVRSLYSAAQVELTEAQNQMAEARARLGILEEQAAAVKARAELAEELFAQIRQERDKSLANEARLLRRANKLSTENESLSVRVNSAEQAYENALMELERKGSAWDQARESLSAQIELMAKEVEALNSRAHTAEEYCRALVASREEAAKTRANEIAHWQHTQEVAKGYVKDLEARAKIAEDSGRALQEELEKTRAVASRERLEFEGALDNSRAYAMSLLQRAEQAEAYSQSLLEEVARLDALATSRAERVLVLEEEITRLTLLVKLADEYRALPWWRKLKS